MNIKSLTGCLLIATLSGARGQRLEYEEEPHNYWSTPLSDTCTTLDKALLNGSLKISLNNPKTMARQVLDALHVSPDTQVLVFSKTSLQRDRIGPATPRALFFNDECYVGWVPGGLMEFAGMDPVLGPVFYSLNPDRPDRAVPRLDRSENCMDCHGGSMTRRLPGVMLRSVVPDGSGVPLLQAGTSMIDYTSPISSRWGGWYVTGGH